MGPGSELRLMVYAKISYKTLWLMHTEGPWEIGTLDPLVAKNSEAQTGCPVTYTYTRKGLDRFLKGFEITEAKNPTSLLGMLNTTSNTNMFVTKFGRVSQNKTLPSGKRKWVGIGWSKPSWPNWPFFDPKLCQGRFLLKGAKPCPLEKNPFDSRTYLAKPKSLGRVRRAL